MYQKQKMLDYIKKELSMTSPIECDFKVGDKVIFTNDFGIEFERRVVGFSSDSDLFKYGNFIHLDNGAYWYPHNPNKLRHAN